MAVMQQNTTGQHEEPALSGDCIRACVSSLFEESWEHVPHFLTFRGPMAWWEEVRRFHRGMGFDVAATTEAETVRALNDPTLWPDLAYASVPSPRGPWEHLVLIGPDGRIAHDPFPGPTNQTGEVPGATEWWVVCQPYPFPDEYAAAAPSGDPGDT